MLICTGQATWGPAIELGGRWRREVLCGGLETGLPLITVMHISWLDIPILPNSSDREGLTEGWALNNQGEMTVPLVNFPLCLNEPFIPCPES